MSAAAVGARTERNARRLAAVGAWGTALTLAIVGASVLVRLSTRIEAGEAVSMLPQAVETAVRIAHRVAAMGVAVAAAIALVATLSERPVPAARMAAAAAIVLLTLLLASIGRYTPGYRFAAITVANVVGGTALACAFWWLRELCGARAGGLRTLSIAAIALGLWLLASGIGAASSALALHGVRAYGPAHLLVATLACAAALGAAWAGRGRPCLAWAVVAFIAFEFASGFGVLARALPEWRVALAWAHAMGAAVVGVLLVRLAAGKILETRRDAKDTQRDAEGRSVA